MKKGIWLFLLIMTSCKQSNETCTILGKWKSVEFLSDKEVDLNQDGIYNKDLLKEDPCTEVNFHFMKNGKVTRYYKNKKTGCKTKKSTLKYVVKEDKILFIVSGMRQKHRFKIRDCKLTLYGISGRGKTEKGKESIKINSLFEKQ